MKPTEISGLVLAVAALAPLVKSLHKWHMDIRRSKADKPTTTRQQKTSNRWELWLGVSGMALCNVLFIIWILLPDSPASRKDVFTAVFLVISYGQLYNLAKES